MSEIVRVSDVGVHYSKRIGMFRRHKLWALRHVDFAISQGERIGIVGVNGCGKSTLLRLLAGVIEPSEGQVWSADIQIGLLALGVGMVAHLTGRENALLNGMLLGIPRREINARMDEIQEFSGLGEAFDDPFYSYSTGMRMRVSFSVSLFANPDLLLLDEVMGVGDAGFREKSKEAMLERFDADNTIVLVSHSAGQIEELCERVLWIHEGCIHRDGPPDEVLPAYGDHLKTIREQRRVERRSKRS